MVSLVDQGWADQNEVAETFGYSVRTLRRDQRRFEPGAVVGYDLGEAMAVAVLGAGIEP